MTLDRRHFLSAAVHMQETGSILIATLVLVVLVALVDLLSTVTRRMLNP